MLFILLNMLRDFSNFVMFIGLLDFIAIFLKRFLILISVRRGESHHGLSFSLIAIDFSEILYLICGRKVDEKLSKAWSISTAPRINTFQSVCVVREFSLSKSAF